MKQQYIGMVKDGKLILNNRRGFDEDLKQYEGLEVAITMERFRHKRSTAQNALWWVYMTILGKELGYAREEIHEICKFKFLKRQMVDEKSGEVYEYLGSTSKLNKTEFGELIDNLIRWAAEMNIVLPEPNTQMTI